MRRTVRESQMQGVSAFAYQNALFSQRDAWRIRRAGVSDEYTLPDRRTLGGLHVLHIEHELRKALVEHSWLNFKRDLRRLELVLQSRHCRLRARGHIGAIGQRQKPRRHRKNRDDP